MMDVAPTTNRHVVACIPYYHCPMYIRRAVKSLLAQTHKNISVVVLNDGDRQTPPWPRLADIKDPRLIRFDMKENRGPYFATQVLLSVTKAPYFLIQDSDDWSHPKRVEFLLNSMECEKSNFAVSAQPQVLQSPEGVSQLLEIRWLKNKDTGDNNRSNAGKSEFKVNKRLDPKFLYRLPHHGLFRTSALRNVGGYHPGFRINYDCVVPNLMLMTGKVSHVPVPLYYRFRLNDSITHSAQTGVRSIAAQHEKEIGGLIYSECYNNYMHFINGHISSESLATGIRRSILRLMNKELRASLYSEANRFAKYVSSIS